MPRHTKKTKYMSKGGMMPKKTKYASKKKPAAKRKKRA
mgnify:CR=1 FL=1|jgi:hypothetical protein|tara:strand:- start:626 stop:739 length:114 start_codon:yes stop_codon:yes gene_type:complete